MADDRLPLRSASIDMTRSDNVMLRRAAISLNACQKALSRLTLVFCPPMMIERLTISDFIAGSLSRSAQKRGGPSCNVGRTIVLGNRGWHCRAKGCPLAQEP